MNARAQGASSNPAAERLVLGALIRNGESYFQIGESLKAEHFSIEIHQKVYAAIATLVGDGHRATLQAIVARVGEEYDEGQSTNALLSALRHDAEDATGWQDEAGTIIGCWVHRRAMALRETLAKDLARPGAHAEDVLADLKEKIDGILTESATEPVKWIGDVAKKVLVQAKKAEDGFRPGYSTGLASLDEIMGLIHAGDFGVIGARQGDAKTVLATMIAQHVAKQATVGLFELEMKDTDIGRRALSGETRLRAAEIEEGSYNYEGYESLMAASERLAGLSFFIDDRPRLRMEQIYDRCRQVKRQRGLVMAVIDHFRLVRLGRKVADKWERMEEVSGLAKMMAKDLGIAVIMLSQVTRSSQRGDDPVPTLTDLDGGGVLEQDADWALTMVRRDRWLLDRRPSEHDDREYGQWTQQYERWKGLIEIHVKKHRRMASGVSREFLFDGPTTMIRERER